MPDAIGLRAVSAPMGLAPYLLPNDTTRALEVALILWALWRPQDRRARVKLLGLGSDGVDCGVERVKWRVELLECRGAWSGRLNATSHVRHRPGPAVKPRTAWAKSCSLMVRKDDSSRFDRNNSGQLE